jgi:hypothetical protein
MLIEAGPVGGSFGFDVDAAAWTGFGPVIIDFDVVVGGATIVDTVAIGATAGGVVTPGDLRTIVQEGCTVSSLMGGVMFYDVTGQHTKPLDIVYASPTHPAHLPYILPLCSSRLTRPVSVLQASLTNVCDLIEGVFEIVVDQIRDLSFLRTRLPISVAHLIGGSCGRTHEFQKQKVGQQETRLEFGYPWHDGHEGDRTWKPFLYDPPSISLYTNYTKEVKKY